MYGICHGRILSLDGLKNSRSVHQSPKRSILVSVTICKGPRTTDIMCSVLLTVLVLEPARKFCDIFSPFANWITIANRECLRISPRKWTSLKHALHHMY